jgi:hypothetical protein
VQEPAEKRKLKSFRGIIETFNFYLKLFLSPKQFSTIEVFVNFEFFCWASSIVNCTMNNGKQQHRPTNFQHFNELLSLLRFMVGIFILLVKTIIKSSAEFNEKQFPSLIDF